MEVLELKQVILTLKGSLMRSTVIKCILCPQLLNEFTFNKRLDLILTRETIYKFKLKGENTRLWCLNRNLSLNLAVLDDSVFLNLSHINETTDTKLYLVSTHKKAIEWGNELFNYYLNPTKPVNF